ncbi:MAG: HAD family hydrolase [Parachlamydiaceae bacterium]
MSQKFFFFDLDHTLLKINISFTFGKYLFQKGELPLFKMCYCTFQYLKHKYCGLTLQRLQSAIFDSYFAGKDAAKIEEDVNVFLDTHFSSFLQQSVYHIFLEHMSEGHRIFIFSSSPDFLVRPIAQRLGVPYEATQYIKDCSNRFSSIGQVLCGQSKAQLVKKILAEAKEVDTVGIFTDSFQDLPFLRMATHPVAVNPDYQLKQLCYQNNWTIL